MLLFNLKKKILENYIIIIIVIVMINVIIIASVSNSKKLTKTRLKQV